MGWSRGGLLRVVGSSAQVIWDRGALDVDDAPPACDLVEVALFSDCPDPAPEPAEEGVEEGCELGWAVDGQRYTGWQDAFPADVEREGEVWLRADPTSGVDRVTRTSASEGSICLHVIDRGWQRFYAPDWPWQRPPGAFRKPRTDSCARFPERPRLGSVPSPSAA